MCFIGFIVSRQLCGESRKQNSRTRAASPASVPSSSSVTYKQSFSLVESVVFNFLIKTSETDWQAGRQTNGEGQAESLGRQIAREKQRDRQRGR